LNISDCTILDSDNVGLLLENVRHSRVAGCLIRDDRPDASSLAISLTGQGNLLSQNLLGRPSSISPGSTVDQ
jgi:hypothetical protein